MCSCPFWNEELHIVVAAGRTARERYSNQKVCSTCRVVFVLIKVTAMFYVSLFENIWKRKDKWFLQENEVLTRTVLVTRWSYDGVPLSKKPV